MGCRYSRFARLAQTGSCGRPSPTLIQKTFLVFLLALCAAACSSPPSRAVVQVNRGFGELWDGFVAIAERQGYMMDRRDSDRGLRVFVSHWRENPAPFGMGSRTRLHGEFERPEDGSPGWQLRFYVQRQVVKDMRPGFEPNDDDWSDNGQDRTREDVILGQLRLRFGQELGVQPTYKQ